MEGSEWEADEDDGEGELVVGERSFVEGFRVGVSLSWGGEVSMDIFGL